MLYREALFPTYAPPPIAFARGRGVWLEDTEGGEYLDFIAGIAVNSLGHCHPRLVDALTTQAGQLWHLSNMFDIVGQQELAARYCELSFADAAFFANSGAEAVECALKAARRYHYCNGHPERIEIIGLEGAFHGRTYASVNAAGNPKYLEGFGPSLAGYLRCRFDDLESLESMISPTTAAVIVEPIQGEGGVRALSTEYLTALREICTAYGILLIFDEVQSGAGRTGKLFAHEWVPNCKPDIMALAKGIGGGFPLGLCLATSTVAAGMTPGTHGTTYGGNALAVAVGSAVLDELTAPGFLQQVNDVSDYLHRQLRGLASELPDRVLEVRGKGLLAGIRVAGSHTAVRDAARDRQLLVGIAGADVVRLAPPLIVNNAHVDTAIERLRDALLAG
jgi:acetylornithine/N-succinyldiaminopimelate aminotransferase